MNNKVPRKKRESKKIDEISISINNLLIISCLYRKVYYPYELMKVINYKYNVKVPLQSIYTLIKKYMKLNMIYEIKREGTTNRCFTLSKIGENYVIFKKKEYEEVIDKVNKEIIL